MEDMNRPKREGMRRTESAPLWFHGLGKIVRPGKDRGHHQLAMEGARRLFENLKRFLRLLPTNDAPVQRYDRTTEDH